MSTAPNLTLVSEVLPVIRRDFALASPGLLDPMNNNPLLDGEWMQLDSSYKLARGANEQVPNAFQVFAERGRYDTQAAQKTTVLYMGYYEAETSICDVTGAAVGDKLMVVDVSIGGVNKRALKKVSGNGQHMIFGHVTRLVGTTKLRYICHAGWPIQITI